MSAAPPPLPPPLLTQVMETLRGQLLTALGQPAPDVQVVPETATAPTRSSRKKTADRKSATVSQPSVELAATDSLRQLVERFSLTEFERNVLVLCASVEMDREIAALVKALQLQLGSSVTGPTFTLAVALSPDLAHWTATPPIASLRRWRLLDLQSEQGITGALLRIDERVLHYLAGVRYTEPRLRGVVEPVLEAEEISAGQQTIARDAVAAWQGPGAVETKPILFFLGSPLRCARAVAQTVTTFFSLGLHRLPAHRLPVDTAERVHLARLWDRESMLLKSCLLLEIDASDSSEVLERARHFAQELAGFVFVAAPNALDLATRSTRSWVVPALRPEEQLARWKDALGPAAAHLNGTLERASHQFKLEAPAIARASRAVLNGSPAEAPHLLWRAARAEARRGLDQLAQRIDSPAAWSDLILPESQLQVLRTLIAQMRQQTRVLHQWGFADRHARGLGLSALFAGPSGTGKTLAAEVIANELQLDLHRIDLSGLVSKYIGETEKNLRRVFEAAEQAGSVLLFDEADALFGKRSEVRDSHDRYANIEVSYLLQRLESYRGLALLTTNRRTNLDPAFARRFRFALNFQMPDQVLREQIWRRAFPDRTPRENLDYPKLSRLTLAGGHIHNVALNAAFLAADAGSPVRMAHLLTAVQAEFANLEKPLNPAEIADW